MKRIATLIVFEVDVKISLEERWFIMKTTRTNSKIRNIERKCTHHKIKR